MQILCSQLHTLLKVLKKKLQATGTYTKLKHGRIFTLSCRRGVLVLGEREDILSLLSHFVTIGFPRLVVSQHQPVV
jgi:hypothetical protein